MKEEEFEDARKCSIMGPFLLMDEIAPKHSLGKGVLELADGRVGTRWNSSCWPGILPNVVWIYILQLLLEPVALQTGKQQGTIIQSMLLIEPISRRKGV